MEKLGQNYGYILYRSALDTENHMERIRLWKANDRANIFVDGKPVATLYDLELQNEKKLDVSFENANQCGARVTTSAGRIPGRASPTPRPMARSAGTTGCTMKNT